MLYKIVKHLPCVMAKGHLPLSTYHTKQLAQLDLYRLLYNPLNICSIYP